MALSETESKTSPRAIGLVAAFAAVYLIWGSTFLVIKYAIETLPPFLMAGTRYLLAGVILWCYVRSKDRTPLTWSQWRATGIIGILMMLGGNGLVTFAEQYIASGLAALLIATTPLWLVLFDWLFCRGSRPTMMTVVGLAVGLFGVYLLIGPSSIAGAPVDAFGATLCLFACVFWASGSLYSRHAGLPKSTQRRRRWKCSWVGRPCSWSGSWLEKGRAWCGVRFP